MSRPLRIEFPGAWYHVMNRGRRSETIFSEKADYSEFLDLLIEISGIWNANIAAYCLMPNHYHVLLQTPGGNISRCMRHLNGLYTQRYNRRHGFDGQLFRGRYKSILVCNDSHLLELVRYIHKNPVAAGVVKEMGGHEWSSYSGYLSYSKKWKWLHKDYIFSMITPKKKGRLKPFIEFMQDDDSQAVANLFSKKNLPSIFGPESFITRIKEEYHFSKTDYEIPESKSLASSSDDILSVICGYFNVSTDELMASRRGVFNNPRNVAIYLLRNLRGDNLNDIKNIFQINAYSTVSSIIQTVSRLTKSDKKFRRQVEEIKNKISKGQV